MRRNPDCNRRQARGHQRRDPGILTQGQHEGQRTGPKACASIRAFGRGSQGWGLLWPLGAFSRWRLDARIGCSRCGDGVLCEPMPISVASGGVLVVAGDGDLRYDLSGLRDQRQKVEDKLPLWQAEAKAMKAQLRVSVANSTLRAESMPSQYYQASGYAFWRPSHGNAGGQSRTVFSSRHEAQARR